MLGKMMIYSKLKVNYDKWNFKVYLFELDKMVNTSHIVNITYYYQSVATLMFSVFSLKLH